MSGSNIKVRFGPSNYSILFLNHRPSAPLCSCELENIMKCMMKQPFLVIEQGGLENMLETGMRRF